MAFDSTKPLKKAGNLPVPQYWNDEIEDWEVVKGSGGSYNMSAPVKLAKEPFSGSANLTKEFASEMSGFVISNDGNADLTFTIDGDTYVVKAGEVFEEEFAPFTTVTITTTVAFRAYGKITVGGIAVAPPTQNPDVTAPDNVTNLVASSITQNSLTLTWTASASNDTVGYDVYRGTTLLGSVTGTTYNVSGLTASTQYTFIVKAKDAANNIASGTSVPATTIAQPADTTPPANVTGLTPSNITATGVTLTWTASVASDIKDYNVYNGSTLLATVTDVTYNVTGLTASTSYTFTVKARDTANNEASGTQINVTTAAPADTTAPVITAAPAAGTFTSTQSVTLSSNEGGTTIFYTTDGSTPTTSSTQYSSAIAINATTTLKYFGRDAAGNSSAVQTAAYTINLADTTAPNPVTGLSAGTPTSNSVPLTWTISSSGDVATQEVAYSTDGTNFTVASAVVNAASNSYTVTGLSASTAYTFRVVAVDGAGNRSTAVTTTATTSASAGQPVGTNLFNKTMVTAGNYVNTSTGANTALAGWNASDFIQLEPRQIYTANPTTGNKAYYNSSQVFTQNGTGIGLNGADYVGTPNRSFIRVSVQDANLNTYSFIKTGKINLIDTSTNLAGKSINPADGTVSTTSGYQATDFIPVTSGSTYVQPNNSMIANRCEYDSNHVFLRTVANNLADTEHVIGANTAYVRFNVSNANAPEAYYYLKS